MTATDVGFCHADQAQAQIRAHERIGTVGDSVGDVVQPVRPRPTRSAGTEVRIELPIVDSVLLAIEPGRERGAPTVLVGAADELHGGSLTTSVEPMTPRRALARPGAAGRTVADAKITARALEARAGDRPALGEFIRLTQSDVWRFVAHLAGQDAADDLTQETYLRAMDALPSYRGESSARAWLLAIARRTAVDHFRKEAGRPQAAPASATDQLTVPDGSVRIEVQQMLASLDPVRREALLLTQVFGFSYAETAAITGVAIGTVRSRVARARAELVDEWSDAIMALRYAG